MHLKRLDIIGFKSFAERISVDFVPGVTCVVGPNGSGKSNIIDAIRWVLGEQSAKSLRGSKMEDIIFAGSDSRKPLNFAEVTLTLENEDRFLPIDYQEVSVTRRVYRSGESEYFINKQSCRLRDIVDLFMDSGLGREAFSIISQGKVEEILNSKAEDRRTIFEEAAGVLKYKTRKKKAEAKLEETEDNLHRVNDIIHELERQLEPLKIQASIAKDYLEQKEELEKIEVALTVYEIEELHEKWESLKMELEKNTDIEMELQTNIQKKEAEITDLRDKIAALDESINDLQQVLLVASEELEKLEGKKEVLKERKKNATQNKIQLENTIKELTNKIEQLKTVQRKQTEEVNVLKKARDECEKLLVEKQRLLHSFTDNVEEKIESLKSDYIEILNRQAALKNEWQHLTSQLQQIENRKEQLAKTNEKYLVDREEIVKRKGEISESLREMKISLEESIHQFREEERKLESLRNQFSKQEKNLYEGYQFIQKAKSRKDMLEEMEEDFTGFYQGVREVLKERNGKLLGIKGAIAELIHVPKELEIAIEIALGASMQHIVVETEEYAREAIRFLKQHSYGRATFLPLNVIKGKEFSQTQKFQLQGHPSFVGVAAELIQFDPQYQDVIFNLLGHVVITKDLKGANELAERLQYRYRFVTLDGDVVNPGGSMTGGAIHNKKSSLLSRKGELEQLKVQLVEMEKQLEKKENFVKQLKAQVQQQELYLNELRKNGEELRLKENTIKGSLREIEIEEKNINEKLALYDFEMEQFSIEQKEIQYRQFQLKEELTKYEEEIGQLEQHISQLTERKNSEKTSRESLLEEINALKIELAAKNEQFSYAEEKLVTISKDLQETENKKIAFSEDLQLLMAEMSDNTSGEEQLQAEAERRLLDKNETLELLKLRRDERVQLHTKVEDLEGELKELKRQHKGVAEILKTDEVKINRLDVELETRLNHLREEYLLTFEGAKEQYPLTLPVDEAKRKVKLIKRSIEELGVVNIGAIEEYDRVSERYEFLKEQQTDLMEAKDTLFQVIEEMDGEMKKRFSETFSSIRTQFDPVFRALFGGGQADLKLTDPNDLLNTGVEIVAQPPGKKLQNLGLLSGGERALTAIALLFAILKVRPVPFCILDEVEAALDEANVYRFSQYLKNYSDETQFIVITHRRGTMEGADVLYGVTMEESGVSKLVSVRLEETDELVLT